jgi:hypothetical protein
MAGPRRESAASRSACGERVMKQGAAAERQRRPRGRPVRLVQRLRRARRAQIFFDCPIVPKPARTQIQIDLRQPSDGAYPRRPAAAQFGPRHRFT